MGNLVGVINIAGTDIPLVGAEVIVTAADGTEQRLVTDAQGRWELKELDPGEYRVRVSAAGYQPTENTEVLAAGDEVTATYRLAPEVEGIEVTVRGERPHRAENVLAAAAPDDQLGVHERQPDGENAHEVDEDERSAPVLAGDVGELPDVAESHRAPGGGENEPETSSPVSARLRGSGFREHGRLPRGGGDRSEGYRGNGGTGVGGCRKSVEPLCEVGWADTWVRPYR